jgi:lysozyme
MTREEFMVYQRLLRALGRDVAVDGIPGPESLAAAHEALRAATAEPPAPVADPETELLMAELLRDEGFVPHAYQDSLGFWTIGIGRLVDRRKGGRITRAEADYLKANDVAEKRRALDAKIPWWRDLDPVRQRAVQNMAFQLGTGDMGGVTFAMIHYGKYAEAAARLRRWEWAAQTPERAGRVIRMIETGRI